METEVWTVNPSDHTEADGVPVPKCETRTADSSIMVTVPHIRSARNRYKKVTAGVCGLRPRHACEGTPFGALAAAELCASGWELGNGSHLASGAVGEYQELAPTHNTAHIPVKGKTLTKYSIERRQLSGADDKCLRAGRVSINPPPGTAR
ncbi:unnamed protein product [Gadus morhua 'NCC']